MFTSLPASRLSLVVARNEERNVDGIRQQSVVGRFTRRTIEFNCWHLSRLFNRSVRWRTSAARRSNQPGEALTSFGQCIAGGGWNSPFVLGHERKSVLETFRGNVPLKNDRAKFPFLPVGREDRQECAGRSICTSAEWSRLGINRVARECAPTLSEYLRGLDVET
jgi:hypothetical protein